MEHGFKWKMDFWKIEWNMEMEIADLSILSSRKVQ